MSFYALFLAINHFIGCLGSEWQACPAYSPPATIIVSIIYPAHRIQQPIPKLMSSSSHIRRVEISSKPRNFRQSLDVNLLFFFSADHPHSE